MLRPARAGVRRARLLVWAGLAVVAALVLLAGPQAGKVGDVEENGPTSQLPRGFGSTLVEEELPSFGQSEIQPAAVVYERPGGLTDADRSAIEADRGSFGARAAEGQSVTLEYADDGAAALLVVPVDVSTDEGFDLVEVFRDALETGHPTGLAAEVTGPPATMYDQVAVFDGLDTRLLLASAGVVVVLLLLTYRSPVLWLLPMLSIGVAMVLSQAATYLLATPRRPAGQRPERRRHADHGLRRRDGLRAARDLPLPRGAAPHRGPAGGPHPCRTAVAGAGARLGRDRGPRAVLPVAGRHERHPQPRRRVRGRRGLRRGLHAGDPAGAAGPDRPWVFWPFRPLAGQDVGTSGGGWARTADLVRAQPRAVWACAVLVLGGLALGSASIAHGATYEQQFRDPPGSVRGQAIVDRHFTSGQSRPPPSSRAPRVPTSSSRPSPRPRAWPRSA